MVWGTGLITHGMVITMKRSQLCLIGAAVLLFAFCWGQGSPGTNSILLRNISIQARGKSWNVLELEQTARRSIASKGGLRQDAITKLQILADDQNTMCVFEYRQGFGRPLWFVGINYDGGVQSSTNYMLKEGMPPGMPPPPPPEEPPPQLPRAERSSP